jgi:hypothetical protein
VQKQKQKRKMKNKKKRKKEYAIKEPNERRPSTIENIAKKKIPESIFF